MVALHPDWAGSFRGAPPAWGWSCSTSTPAPAAALEPTESAAFWVSRFLDGDVFDVLDAVELSGVIRAGAAVGDAERTVAAALVLGEPLPEGAVDGLLEWLEAGCAGLSPRRRDELFDVVVASRPRPAQLQALSRIAAASDNAGFRDRIRWQVFGVIVEQVDGRESGAITDVGQARRRLEVALADATPEQLVALLDLAADHTLAPNPARFADALRAFARWWADGGLDVPGVERWACEGEAVDLLRDELARRLTGASAATAEAVGDMWWRRLWHTIQDPRSPLDQVIAAAAMEHGDATVRSAVTRTVLDALARVGAPDATDVAWRALFSRYAPTAADLLPVLAVGRVAGRPSAQTVAAVADMLEADPQPGRATLDALATLAELDVDPVRPVLRALQREVVAVRGLRPGSGVGRPAARRPLAAERGPRAHRDLVPGAAARGVRCRRRPRAALARRRRVDPAGHRARAARGAGRGGGAGRGAQRCGPHGARVRLHGARGRTGQARCQAAARPADRRRAGTRPGPPQPRRGPARRRGEEALVRAVRPVAAGPVPVGAAAAAVRAGW